MGGIFAGVGPAMLQNSTVSNNSGRTGGINMFGQLTLIKSKVTGNTSTQTTSVEPGGIDIASRNGHLTLTSSTVSGNTPCDICED